MKKETIFNRKTPSISEGLSSNDVLERVNLKYTNTIKDPNRKSYFQIVLGNIFTPFNILMYCIAILLVAVIGFKILLNLGFMVIIISNIIIGTIQECRSKRILNKLKLLNIPKVNVVRDGEIHEILPNEIVIDDILALQIGDQIPVDCIIKTNDVVEVNESLLTGESIPVKKTYGDLLYAGSYIVSGSTRVLTDKLGNNTYIHSIESKAKGYKKPKSRLLTTINRIITLLAGISIPLAVIVFCNEIISQVNEGSELNFANAVQYGGFAISYMIPAGLVLISSIAMMTGAVKLASKKTLSQDLYSVESLARVNVLACDKTGTLTNGEMEVDDILLFDNSIDFNKLIGSYLNAFKTENSTSKALLKHFVINNDFLIEKCVEFSSIRKFSMVQFNKLGAFALGAPDYMTKDKGILDKVEEYSNKGLRVVALAKLNGLIKDEDNLPKVDKIIGLIAIRDSVRPEVPSTLKWFRENDVDLLVISGDNVNTVSHIAKVAGLEQWDKCLDLSKYDDLDDIEDLILETKVFGRVSPEQKAKIVEILQRNGKIVAMTGDGINDLVSLKKADCSIALANGAPATKNLANFVLMDSNFSNMKEAVFEGRRVINNIQRSSTLFIMKDWCWFFVTLFPLLFGFPHLIEPTIMTLVNVFLTGIGSFFLALEADKNRITGNMYKSVMKKAIVAGLFMFLPVFIAYVVAAINVGLNVQDINHFVDPLYNSSVAIDSEAILYQPSLLPCICICSTVAGFVVLYDICKPLTKYRKILFIGLAALIIFILCAVPQCYLINGTEYMSYIETLPGNKIANFISNIFSNLFTFKMYQYFELYQWIFIGGFCLLALPVYYGLKYCVGMLLDNTFFRNKNFEDK